MRILYGLALIVLAQLINSGASGQNNVYTMFVWIVGIVSIISFFINYDKGQKKALYEDLRKIEAELENSISLSSDIYFK